MLTILLIVFCIVFIVVSTTRFKLHPFLALVGAAFIFGIFSGMPLEDLVTSFNKGFGDTLGSIGVIIVVGIIIGTFLENSGGAYAMADRVLSLIGQGRVRAAMAAIGYIVSIPVFADSGFIILSPLNKALTKKAGLSLAGTAIALALGLTATHTMVPPTPGPIAAAGIVGADVGLVILFGMLVSIPALVAAVLISSRFTRKVHIDPDPDLKAGELEKITAEAPSAIKSFLPILVPIVLIVLKSIAAFPSAPFGDGRFTGIITFIGNPVVALLLGMVLAFTLPKKLDKQMLSATGWVGKAMRNAAVIILVTGAGGAFGKVLQQSGLGDLLEQSVGGNALGLWLPFLVAAALKTAQGSGTVAIITSASIMVPLMPALGMDGELSRALVVVAIGAGANVTSHANDSFFWVVTQMSGMNVQQGYRMMSSGMVVLGLAAMVLLTVVNLFV